VIGDRQYLIVQILAGKVLEHGVSGKNGGRNDSRFNAGRGNDGQRHGQRALSHTGYVLDGNDSFHDNTSFGMEVFYRITVHCKIYSYHKY